MSHFGTKPEQSTTAEATLLTQLFNLATTPSGYAIAKNSDGTFSNISLTGVTSVTVAQGGTGVASFTPYAIIVGGTTATGALQQVSGLGSAGYVLTSNGAGGLPSWQALPAAGSGTVTSVSVTTANGVSGAVATATTTPAITITLGALTGVTSLNGLVVTANTGVITTGTWNATVIIGTYGGTGVNNGTNTITVAGNFAVTTNGGTISFSGASKTLTVANSITISGTDAKSLVLTTGLTVTTNDGTIAFGAASKTLTVNKSLALDGTDSTTMTFPSTSATIARTDAGQTFTGVNIFTSPKIITQISDTNGNVLVNIGATGSAVNYVKITNAATGTAGPILAADGETNVDLKIAAKGTGKVHRTTGEYGDITAYTPSAAGTATLTLNTSNVHSITMPAGNITIALSNEGVGQCFIIRIIQDGTGSRTVTWFTTIKWAGGTVPTLTTTASKVDVFGFTVTSAGNYDGYIIGQNL